MKEKLLSLFALMSLGLSPLALADNKLCPIMIEDETDEEEVVEFEGKKVLFCCKVRMHNLLSNLYILCPSKTQCIYIVDHIGCVQQVSDRRVSLSTRGLPNSRMAYTQARVRKAALACR